MKILISLIFGVMVLTGVAQETVYQIDEVTVINYGDGRLLFRQLNEQKTPLNGLHRIINGYSSECFIAEFKDGMYNGSFQHLKNNKLRVCLKIFRMSFETIRAILCIFNIMIM